MFCRETSYVFTFTQFYCLFTENCPSNQVFSTCAGCSTTCEERSRFKVCTLQCRQQCTCPPNLPYLNGDTCVTADQCPSTNPAGKF